MRYSKYLKDLGLSRIGYLKLKYNHCGIFTKYETLKYGTNWHEMWNLDIILAIEIYPRLKHLYEKYHYVCNFSDTSVEDFSEKYDKVADERFNKVLYSFEMLIKIWLNPELEECPNDMLTNPNSQYNKIQEGFNIFGEGFWEVGI